MKGYSPGCIVTTHYTDEIEVCQEIYLTLFNPIPIIENMSILPVEKRNRQLTEKQQKFLDNLVTTGGNPKQAAQLAGYSENYHQVLRSLKDEVLALAEDVLVQHAPRAAFKLIEVMDSDKPIAQANNKLQAAQTLLDRVGIAKTDTLNVNHQANNGIFIMPDKKEIIIEAERHEDIPD